jgi:hypothetical protein
VSKPSASKTVFLNRFHSGDIRAQQQGKFWRVSRALGRFEAVAGRAIGADNFVFIAHI